MKQYPSLKNLNTLLSMKDPFEKISIMDYFIGSLISVASVNQEQIDQAEEEWRKFKCRETPDRVAAKQVHDAEMLRRCSI